MHCGTQHTESTFFFAGTSGKKKRKKKASVKVKVFSRCVGGTQRLTPEGGTVAVNRRKPSAGPGSPVDDQRVTQKEIQLSEH